MKKIKQFAAFIFAAVIANAQNGASMEYKYTSSKGVVGSMMMMKKRNMIHLNPNLKKQKLVIKKYYYYYTSGLLTLKLK